MKTKYLLSIPGIDISLFAKMASEYVFEEEKVFFERLSHDESNIQTICGQIYIHENDNQEGIFFIRRNSHEYELDNATIPQGVEAGGYYDSLSEVLSVFLDEINIHDEHITFLEWLRSKKYACVRYDNNLDKM